ncbi:MAG TPA: 3'-5' exonuclease [Polyangiaceae bacterium]|nr:3'-5' exonuclease [Polyangiaceae bacterium]
MKSGADGGGCFPTGRHYPGIAHLLRIVAAGLADECAGDSATADIPLAAIDTETTGRDPEVDRIVEIACVTWRNGTVVARHGWLVNPGRPIPKEATDVHGIKDEDVRDKPTFDQIAGEVVEALRGSVPVAYNAEFDRAFLMAELARTSNVDPSPPPACRKGVEWIDPLVWARELHKLEKSKALGEVCARLGITIAQAHRATDDAEAALRVLSAFCEDVRVPKTYAALVQEQRRLARLHDDERKVWRARAN